MAGKILMVARSVGKGNDRTVVQLEAVPDPTRDNEAGGGATLLLNDPDDQDMFEQGKIYELSFSEGSAPEDSPLHTQSLSGAMAEQAAAIPNSTNTADYTVPVKQKIPPPQVPDGVVTEPRPAVVMEPPAGAAPATAGTLSPPADNPTPDSPTQTTQASGGTSSTTARRSTS